MKRIKKYWFNLVDSDYNDLKCWIPDGSNKQTAVNYAKRWMKEYGVKNAFLSVNSMRTSNILDFIEIEL